ncbi:MAG: SGNH/GDSL hydrolase family protein [Christensenella sp.]|uniref:SGNH/GDSL hydrolase family protein n=1 Tax=Christensenella sp. TaxID=1935934 RepID=UPI002B2179F3|nr:SGNH/GDSL hydrolase family protein [Christensenella sp.]MEA5003108.1 SGNH/GDSL hydrolase family protein [Christensenella sp.]
MYGRSIPIRGGVQSILVMGDSVAKGVVFHPEKQRYIFSKNGFIRRLGEKLKASVHDFSKFGTTASYGETLLKEKLSDLNPDLVLIEYGGNDCDYKWDEVALDPTALHLPHTPVREYGQKLRQMIESLLTLGKIPVLMNLPPLNAASYFRWFTKNDPQRAHNILKWLRDVSKIYWWQEKYSYAAEQIADSLGIHIINVRSAFLRQNDYREFICEDGIHPNEKGQALIEQEFLTYIDRHASYLMV